MSGLAVICKKKKGKKSPGGKLNVNLRVWIGPENE